MNDKCQLVVFSDKAYNTIIRETFEWDPVETGGILLGYVLDNGCWIVMDVLPPGYGEGREGDNVFHEMGYFEYNRKFVNYLAQSVANQYEIPLELLGLWHRHPGSMDSFSGTDDSTNATFAAQNSQGVISGLVNVDPQFRLTMYYLDHNDMTLRFGRPYYDQVDVEVGDELIPEEYFKLKYLNSECRNLHPSLSQNSSRLNKGDTNCGDNEGANGLDVSGIVDKQLNEQSKKKGIETFLQVCGSKAMDIIKKNKLTTFLLVVIVCQFGLNTYLWKCSKGKKEIVTVVKQQFQNPSVPRDSHETREPSENFLQKGNSTSPEMSTKEEN